jgi:hypothetical protein
MRAEEIEAVSARATPDYIRTRLPSGRFKEESYAFGKGGFWSGELNDKTIDKMGFMEVARTIATPLAEQGYIPARDPKTTGLLIMVYWGTTYAPEHASESFTYQRMSDATHDVNVAIQQHVPGQVIQQLEDSESAAITAVVRENHRRDNTDLRNAKMLGYDSWWASTFDAHSGTPQELERQDMMHELEEDRYFVVLMAYDFGLLQRESKHKLLWETRFSVSQHHNEFDKQLGNIAKIASPYFGQDSHGLLRSPINDGHVDIGDLRDLGTITGK